MGLGCGRAAGGDSSRSLVWGLLAAVFDCFFSKALNIYWLAAKMFFKKKIQNSVCA